MKFDLKKILALGLICIVVLTLAACENFPFVKPGTTTGGEGDNPDSENTLIFKLNTDGDAYIVAGVSSRSNKEIIIPEKYMGAPVVGIADLAFKDYGFIKSITIPDSVTSIGIGAFFRCTSLTSINVDENNNNYKSVDGNLYTKDGKTLIQYAIGKKDTSFTIPDSVTNIGYWAFYRSTSLTSVTIPDSVTSISSGAFYGCTSLTEINYNGTKAQWNSISKGSSWNNYTGDYIIYCTDGNISK